MNTVTKENSVELLKKLRDVYQGQLDTSVIEEIETVIAALESCDCSGAMQDSEDWKMRVLKVIADVIRLVTNITELMK